MMLMEQVYCMLGQSNKNWDWCCPSARKESIKINKLAFLLTDKRTNKTNHFSGVSLARS